jgi:hypothetical protein
MIQERYKRVCAQISYYSDRMDRAFNRFVQLSIATIGGFIWLKMQPMAKAAENVFPLVRWIIPLLAFVTVVEIVADLRSWYGYRKAEAAILKKEAALLGEETLTPEFPFWFRLEGIRIIIAFVVAIMGYLYLQ